MTTANVQDLLTRLRSLDDEEQRAVVEAANQDGLDVPAEVLEEFHRRVDAAERGEVKDIPAEDVLAFLRERYS